MADLMAKAVSIAPEAGPITTFCRNLDAELTTAIAGVDGLLRSASIQTRQGQAIPIRPAMPANVTL
jgi:hypothetical protein